MQDEPHQPQQKAKPDLWVRLSRGVALVIVLLLIAGSVLILQPQLRNLKEVAAKNKALQETQEIEAKKLKELREELLWLRTDLTYLETIARDRLGRAKDGEYVVRVRESE